jgi:hypothetical protein
MSHFDGLCGLLWDLKSCPDILDDVVKRCNIFIAIFDDVMKLSVIFVHAVGMLSSINREFLSGPDGFILAGVGAFCIFKMPIIRFADRINRRWRRWRLRMKIDRNGGRGDLADVTYDLVVRPMLEENGGDPSALLAIFPDLRQHPRMRPSIAKGYSFIEQACEAGHPLAICGLLKLGASLLPYENPPTSWTGGVSFSPCSYFVLGPKKNKGWRYILLLLSHRDGLRSVQRCSSRFRYEHIAANDWSDGFYLSIENHHAAHIFTSTLVAQVHLRHSPTPAARWAQCVLYWATGRTPSLKVTPYPVPMQSALSTLVTLAKARIG